MDSRFQAGHTNGQKHKYRDMGGHKMEETRHWMCMAPVSSIKILEGLQGRLYHTVRRECLALQDAEQAARTEQAGYSKRALCGCRVHLG